MEIGDRIYEVRKNLGLTRAEFAERLGTNPDEIKNVEYSRLKKPEGKESLYRNICSEFGVSLDWLKTGEGEMFGAMTAQEAVAKKLGELLRSDDPRLVSFLQWLSCRTETELDVISKSIGDYVDILRKNQAEHAGTADKKDKNP